MTNIVEKTNTTVSNEELSAINKNHLDFIENSKQILNYRGVGILQIFVYELIQIMNHEYLKERLEISDATR